MNYREALDYIHSVSWKGSVPGLSRISELCKALGDPQKGMKYVHVTGTNGKGSACAMTESILRAAGYRTGLFTSPFVRDFCERIMLDGAPVSHEKLASATAYVKQFAETMIDKPTEFELITAIALQIFKDEKCDVVVLEVGMGGRLDSTNIIDPPILSVVTGVSLDHTAILGNTLAEIAHEKSGIIKTGSEVLYCGSDIFVPGDDGRDCGFFGISPDRRVREYDGKAPELESGSTLPCDVVRYEAEKLGVPFHFCDYRSLRVKYAGLDGAVFDYKNYLDLKIHLLGLYQPQNAVKAIEIAEVLRQRGLDITESAIRSGLMSVVWHARFEMLCREPVVLYDGGHNPEGIASAVATLKHYFPNTGLNFLTGVMADKDYSMMAGELAPLARKVFAVTPQNPRSLPSDRLASLYRSMGVESEAFDTVAEGYRAAFWDSQKNGTPLICLGSLYMYGEVCDAAGV